MDQTLRTECRIAERSSLADLPEGVHRPAYDRGDQDRDHPSRRRRVSPGASGRLCGRCSRPGSALGHRGGQPAQSRHLRCPRCRRTASIPSRCVPRPARRFRVIGSIRQVIVAPREVETISLEAMGASADADRTLTVTEKGYCHDPATGALNEAHPDIVHDLADPRTRPVRARLHRRGPAPPHAAGVPPFTVLTCDNLPSNGAHGEAGSSPRFAELVDPAARAFRRGRGLLAPRPWSTASCRRPRDADRARDRARARASTMPGRW